MTTLVPAKVMTRKLTAEEEEAIGDFLVANPNEPIERVMDRFGKEFKTLITRTCVTRIALGRIMQE